MWSRLDYSTRDTYAPTAVPHQNTPPLLQLRLPVVWGKIRPKAEAQPEWPSSRIAIGVARADVTDRRPFRPKIRSSTGFPFQPLPSPPRCSGITPVAAPQGIVGLN
ncbi:MAG: hypothetical protein IPL28_24825 [Chloroflexi bacterium]|nr:hypothetical protein [Chloroflexota bacterium]